jgi:iron(III) transport system substrate-binding protein
VTDLKRICYVAIAFIGLFLPGCEESRTQLVIYSPHGRELLGAYEERYEAEHPDVDVQWFPMGAEVGLERVRSERNNPQADLWWGGPSVLFELAERESLLTRYNPTWHENAREGSYSLQNFWYSTFQTIKVIGYNDQVLQRDEAPADWDDMLEPQWLDKVIIRSPMESGTMKSVFAAMVYRSFVETESPEKGYEWLRRLDANTKTYAASPAALMLMLSRQEGLVTLWDLTDILLQRREQQVPVYYRIPSSGAVVLNEGIAIVRGAHQPELARDFYEYVTSSDALLWQARNYFRIPARTDIPDSTLPDWLKELQYAELPLDWTVIGEHREEWMGHWDQAIKGSGH